MLHGRDVISKFHPLKKTQETLSLQTRHFSEKYFFETQKRRKGKNLNLVSNKMVVQLISDSFNCQSVLLM